MTLIIKFWGGTKVAKENVIKIEETKHMISLWVSVFKYSYERENIDTIEIGGIN